VNCRKVNSLLSAYIDGEVTGSEQIHIRRHLRECNGCCEEHESLQQTKQILSRLSTRNPGPVLEERILQRIAEEAERPVPKFDFRGWWGLLPEPDRAALRSGAVFALFALAALLYFRLPVSISDQAPLVAQNNPSHTPTDVLRPMPLKNMLEIHNVGGAAQPVSAGVMPVSNVSNGSAP
jgi:anti-sigma factor RsiW